MELTLSDLRSAHISIKVFHGLSDKLPIGNSVPRNTKFYILIRTNKVLVLKCSFKQFHFWGTKLSEVFVGFSVRILLSVLFCWNFGVRFLCPGSSDWGGGYCF